MALTVLRSIVKLLREQGTADERTLGSVETDEQTTSGAEVMTSQAELEAVVKRGVIEGLAEYEERAEEERTDEQADGSSRSLSKLLAGAAVLGAIVYARRKRSSSKTHNESGDGREVPIDTSLSSGQTADEGTGEY